MIAGAPRPGGCRVSLPACEQRPEVEAETAAAQSADRPGGAGKLGKGIKKAGGTGFHRQMSREWIEINADRMRTRAKALGDEATADLADDIIRAINDGRIEGRIYRTTVDYTTEAGRAIIRPTTETVVRY